MKAKYALMGAILILAVSFCVIAADTEDSDAATTYTITFNSNPSSYGSVNYNTLTVQANDLWNVSGNTVVFNTDDGSITVTATPNSGYYFTGWNKTGSGTVTGNMTFTASFAQSISYFNVTVYKGNWDYFYWVNGTDTTHYTGNSHTYYNVPEGTSFDIDWFGLPSESWSGDYYTAVKTYTHRNDYMARTLYGNSIGDAVTVYSTRSLYPASQMTFTIDYTYTYELVYDANGGSNAPASESATTTTTTAPDSNVPKKSFTISDTEPTRADYEFLGWSKNSGATSPSYLPGRSYNFDYGLNTLYAVWSDISDNVQASFVASPAEGGTVSASHYSVAVGDTYEIEGDTVYLYTDDGTLTVTATPNTGYRFTGWVADGTDPIRDNITFTAGFRALDAPVYWSNDNYNGRVDLLFKFTSPSQAHTMTMDLYSPVTLNHKTIWTDTGKDLTVQMDPNAHTITVTVTGKNPATYNIGSWNTYLISIDTEHGNVSVTPVRVFTSFTDFTLNEKQKHTILDFSDVITDVATNVIKHLDSGNQTNHVRFSVVDTYPFLDSYGVILQDPTINLHDYFPQFDSIRMNFYSFALYGDSITVNGITYPVTNGKVTVTYVSDHGDNYLPDVMPNQSPKTRTFTLTNMYVTYSEDGHAYMTFADDRFTIDLGLYQPNQWVISMTGTWYFATMAYEPYTAYEKSLSGWKAFPTLDSNTMVLIFLGIMGVAFAAVGIHVKRSGFGVVDLAIIGCAALIALMLLVV